MGITIRRTVSFVCAVAVAAVVIPAGADRAGAEESGGLRACDYRSDYDGVPCGEVDRAISESAGEFRIADTRLRSIVRCESRFDPHASRGSYKGLFQQVDDYWSRRVADFNEHHDPDVGDDIYSPFDNSRVSARMLAAGQDDDWPNCA